jgi:hypothetical protein
VLATRGWLRQYATSRKVAGSRHDELNEVFSIYLILPTTLVPGVCPTSNRCEYQRQGEKVSGEWSMCIRLTTRPPSVRKLSRPVVLNLYETAAQ